MPSRYICPTLLVDAAAGSIAAAAHLYAGALGPNLLPKKAQR